MSNDVRWPVGWRDCKAIRLRALASDPAEFGARLATEQEFSDDRWREWSQNFVVGFVAERPVAVGGLVDDEDGERSKIVSMWTQPEFRGRGLAADILIALLRESVRRGRRPYLFVMRDNNSARRLYERNGFRVTGRTEDRDGWLADELALTTDDQR